jgi:rhodanese-related sulfurtransferase
MNTKEILIQVVLLILFSCLATWVELKVIGAPPEIVFLREDKLYPHLPAQGIKPSLQEVPKILSPETASLPTVNDYCKDNKCDVGDLLAVIYISMQTTRELFEAGEAQFVDARKRENFIAGHIPYAINLPSSSFSSGWPDEIQRLVKELKVLVYCDGLGCDASQAVAKHLIRYGFKRVLIIEAGYPGWEREGCPIDKGEGNA